MKNNTHNTIWEAALRLIQTRPHSKKELGLKLKKRFSDEDVLIERVIGEMQNVQLLNDRRFTEDFVHHLIQKPIGRIKIMVETRKKGLDSDLVEQMLMNEGWSEEGSAKWAMEEKDRILNESDPRKRKMKLINFLRNRGFRDEVIYRITA